MNIENIEYRNDLPSFANEPVGFTAGGQMLAQTRWVLGWNGVVQAVVMSNNVARHPFVGVEGVPEPRNYDTRDAKIPLEGWAVFRHHDNNVQRGHLYDEQGNVTQQEGRTRPLWPGEAAYHSPSPDQTRPRP